MHISEIRIRNFRSIDDIRITLELMTVFCGPNSCGKSNVFRAILLAFKDSVSTLDAQQNLTASKLVAGGPMLSIWVDCKLENASLPVLSIAGETSGEINYSFRLTRSGGVTRKLNSKILNYQEFNQFLQHFKPIYVPPIRDLGSDGLVPFKMLIKEALQKSRGAGNISRIGDAAKKILEDKAAGVLSRQNKMANNILHAYKLSLDTGEIDIETLYDNIGLNVHNGNGVLPLKALGTGHQSAVIMHLYRQLGETTPGEVLFLFEEPDNHLHPSTIRAICDDLKLISCKSQVLLNTHSPIFLGHIGFKPLRPLIQNSIGYTELRKITLLDHFTEKEASAALSYHGLRLTEPLLSSRVILVEGPTDKVVLSTLYEKRTGRTFDQEDILIIPAGGKEMVVTLAHLLSCLDVKWRCVMDVDASYSSEVPYSMSALSQLDKTSGINAINTLTPFLDVSRKRGRNAAKLLLAILDEFSNGQIVSTVFDGSPLKRLLEKTKLLSVAEQNQLRTALITSAKRKSLAMLRKTNTFIWSGTIEDVLLRNGAAENCVESTFVSQRLLSAPLPLNVHRRTTLYKKLHESGNTPTVLAEVVVALEDGGHFNKTEVNECFRVVFQTD
jgi:hypothetical protein